MIVSNPSTLMFMLEESSILQGQSTLMIRVLVQDNLGSYDDSSTDPSSGKYLWYKYMYRESYFKENIKEIRTFGRS